MTATGHVEIARGDRILLADKVVYDRNKDIATATGHVALLDDTGSVFFVEKIEVTGDLKEGLAEEVRVLLNDKSRMAGRAFRRRPNNIADLFQAVYSPCDSCTGQNPLWQIKAQEVRYDRDAQMVYYDNAWIEFDGVPVFYTPYLAHPDPTSGPTKRAVAAGHRQANRNPRRVLQAALLYRLHRSRPGRDCHAPFLTTGAGQERRSSSTARISRKASQIRLDGSLMANDPELNEDVRGHFI